jgi:hypothetical protein
MSLYILCPVFMRFYKQKWLERLMDTALSNLKIKDLTTETQRAPREFSSRHSERSEESRATWQKIPRCCRNDNLHAFLCVLCAPVVNQKAL